jgi:hypothetical protein
VVEEEGASFQTGDARGQDVSTGAESARAWRLDESTGPGVRSFLAILTRLPGTLKP